MSLTVEYELIICHECACVIVNGDDSADPERAELAFDHAYAEYGDRLADLVISDSRGCGLFTCDYCSVEDYSESYDAVIFTNE